MEPASGRGRPDTDYNGVNGSIKLVTVVSPIGISMHEQGEKINLTYCYN